MKKHYQVSNEIKDVEHYIYVKRPEDEIVLTACDELPRDQVICVLGPRQLGKSSLIQALTRKKKGKGQIVVNLDFRTVFSSEELVAFKSNQPAWELQPKFADAFLLAVAQELNQYTAYKTWQECHYQSATKTPLLYLERGLENIISHAIAQSGQPNQPILIVCDEWDKLADLGVYTEFLYIALEKWLHQLNIRWILISNTAPLDILKEQKKSKFGFFKKFHLNDFDASNEHCVTEWSAPLQQKMPAQLAFEFAQKTLEITGGQPLLTSLMLDQIYYSDTPSLDELESNTFELANKKRESDFYGHFEYAGEILVQNPSHGFEALKLYETLFVDSKTTASKGLSPVITYGNEQYRNIELLRRAGLIKVAPKQQSHTFGFRSPLHRHVYNQDWIEQQSNLLLKQLPHKTAQRNANETKSKILVINVGGTMGMQVMEDGRVTVPEDENRFFNQFSGITSFAEIVPMSYKPTDGANIGVDHWRNISEIIYRQLKNKESSDYKGIVIIHGTDTLAYTASAVAFALGPHLPLPVVFTGAQSPNNIVHGDSPPNFLRACRVAAESRLKEVVVVFNDRILRAVRTEKRHDYLFDGFHSPSFVELGKIGESIQYPPLTPLANQTNFQFEDSSSGSKSASWKLRNQFTSNILHISQAPGINAQHWLDIAQYAPLKGIFIESLGVFNIPIEGEASYEPIVKAAIDRDIPVLVSSRYPIQPEFRAFYAPAKKVEELGGMIAGNMTVPAALTKFMWALAQFDEYCQVSETAPTNTEKQTYLKKLIQSSYVGELDFDARPQE